MRTGLQAQAPGYQLAAIGGERTNAGRPLDYLLDEEFGCLMAIWPHRIDLGGVFVSEWAQLDARRWSILNRVGSQNKPF